MIASAYLCKPTGISKSHTNHLGPWITDFIGVGRIGMAGATENDNI